MLNKGTAYLDEGGRILRDPVLMKTGVPRVSHRGKGKTRLCPLLAAVVKGWEESGLLPADLGRWFQHCHEISVEAVNPEFTPAPYLVWEALLSWDEDARREADEGVYYDRGPNGGDWHIRWYEDEERARNEVLASKLYQAAGIDVAERHLRRLNGKHCTVSPRIYASQRNNTESLEEQLCDGYVMVM